MPVSSLLEIDPDKLFKECTVQEVEEVQKKLHHEIERKREELRTMVGERYRDLIEAADTIAEMKLISESVIEDVDRMSAATLQMQETQVTGFKLDNVPTNRLKSNKSLDKWSKIAAQIKILVDIIEHIWTAVDCQDFTKATLLFLVAKHIKTSLEMDQTVNTGEYFPVIARQSASIAHFKDTILKGAEDALKAQHLLPKSACGSLISIILLEGLNSSQLLKRYLCLRSSALRAVLSHNYQTQDSSIVKQRLCDSHSLLLNSLLSLCHCFVEYSEVGEGLLWNQLKMVTGKQALPTLQLMNLQESSDVYTDFLPPVVLEFRPQTVKTIEPVPADELKSAVSEWLTWVRRFVTEQGGHLLQILSSLRSLQGLRDAPQAVPEEWSLVIKKLLIPSSLNLWTELYRPLITVRTKQLVNVHWDSSVKYVEHEIKKAVDMALQEGKHTEADLCWHVWKENQNDLTNKPNNSKSSDNRNNKGLWLKSKGISPRVAELCSTLESRLSTLLSDLATVCSDKELDPVIVADTQALKGHQQVVCSEAISRLVACVKKELSGHERSDITSVLLARFLQSVPELCPSLQKCLSSSDSKTLSWQETCTFLYSESLAVYKTWQELMTNTLTSIIKESLKQPTSLTDLLHSTPQWELVTIEEEGEGGEILKSELRVPSSPSLSLQNTLNTIASHIGHTFVPKHVTEELVACLVPTIMASYRSSGSLSVQSLHLQQLLDVKYAAAILIPTHNKALQPLWQETVSEIESRIDPFDLNVFMPYIDDNVKRSVQRTHSLLGVITGCHNIATVLTSKTEEPSVLAMSSSASATWFPLLHITAPHSTRAIHAPKPKGMKKSPSTPTLDTSNESSLKQSASSFFGVMATDWFG